MLNEREHRIQELLGKEKSGQTSERPLGWGCSRPGEVSLNDLTDVALGQASQELAEQVERHISLCAFCRQALNVYQHVLDDDNVSEPEIKGSLLELAARRLAQPEPGPNAGQDKAG